MKVRIWTSLGQLFSSVVDIVALITTCPEAKESQATVTKGSYGESGARETGDPAVPTPHPSPLVSQHDCGASHLGAKRKAVYIPQHSKVQNGIYVQGCGAVRLWSKIEETRDTGSTVEGIARKTLVLLNE